MIDELTDQIAQHIRVNKPRTRGVAKAFVLGQWDQISKALESYSAKQIWSYYVDAGALTSSYQTFLRALRAVQKSQKARNSPQPQGTSPATQQRKQPVREQKPKVAPHEIGEGDPYEKGLT